MAQLSAGSPRTGPCRETDPVATLRVTIMADGLTAMASLGAADRMPSADDLRLALSSAGISHGVLTEVLAELSAGGLQDDDVVVARGDAPLDGEDAWFEPLIARRRRVGVPLQLENGRVDFFDLGYAEAVRVGDPLMRRFPATNGSAGRSVTGHELGQRCGKDRTFRRVGRGTRLSAEDPNLLIATVAGLPIFGPDFVQVDPVLRVPAVDVSTGHITFAGTVIVVGDVATGLRIMADGDVIVAGCVEGAEIIADGEVGLRGGMVGQGRGRVQAGRSVHARFLEGVTVEAGLDVTFEETISHSRITAARDVLALSHGGRGQIVGGQTQAGRSIKVAVLGATVGTVTTVVVGTDPFRDQRLQRVEARLIRLRQDIQSTTQQLIRARMAPDLHSLDPAVLIAKMEGLSIEESRARDAMDRFEQTVIDPARSMIQAAAFFYAGVEAGIGHIARPLHDDLPGATLLLREGRIVARS
ncbi:MAG: DUF342 domain-containing protein [Candidatus Sericytochromatia bacterium]|nr:DUF342 domain-containing protein [Candidatus Sericytochromatia bacterium]